jgi:hypothetical protein
MDYACDWLLGLCSEEWKPLECHMVMARGPFGHLSVLVDPDFPMVWLQRKYLKAFVAFSAVIMPVQIVVDENLFEIYPDRIMRFMKIRQVTLSASNWKRLCERRLCWRGDELVLEDAA